MQLQSTFWKHAAVVLFMCSPCDASIGLGRSPAFAVGAALVLGELC